MVKRIGKRTKKKRSILAVPTLSWGINIHKFLFLGRPIYISLSNTSTSSFTCLAFCLPSSSASLTSGIINSLQKIERREIKWCSLRLYFTHQQTQANLFHRRHSHLPSQRLHRSNKWRLILSSHSILQPRHSHLNERKNKNKTFLLELTDLVQGELVGPLHVGLSEPAWPVHIISFERGLYLPHSAQLVLELEAFWLCCANFQSKQNCGVFWKHKVSAGGWSACGGCIPL